MQGYIHICIEEYIGALACATGPIICVPSAQLMHTVASSMEKLLFASSATSCAFEVNWAVILVIMCRRLAYICHFQASNCIFTHK